MARSRSVRRTHAGRGAERGLRGRAARFRASCAGVSAVEFALLLPILALIFVAAIDLSRAATAASRASFVAETIAGLVSQADHTLTPSEIDGFMLLAPLINPDSLRYGRQTGKTNFADLAAVTVSSIAFSKTDVTCVLNCVYLGGTVFSRSNTGSARPCGLVTASADGSEPTSTTVPTSLYGPDSLVVVDVVSNFKPLFVPRWLMPQAFSRTAYYRPRTLSRINATQNCAAFLIVSADPGTTPMTEG